MGDIYRDTRYRDRDEASDSEYRSPTIRRYKIKPSHEDRYESVEVEDDYRSRYSGRTRDEFVEFERRPERPRSAFETVDDRDRRSAFYERDVNREYSYGDPDRGRITVYESKDSDLDDKKSRHFHDDEIKVERRYEDRFEDAHGHEVDRYRKETEYYTRPSPPPPPVIIRQRYEPQKIVVQEAPPPPPVIIPRQEPGVLVVREKEHHREPSRRDRERDRDRHSEEFYYRHEHKEVGPWRGDPDRDHALAMARFDRHRHRNGEHSDDEDYWVHTRKIVRRERSESPHHKRHLAAGALAGAGITALMTSRPDSHGEYQDNRGKKVIAGTALGALGTEALRRAHSAYGERFRDRSESPDHHSKLKTGLGIAAMALAAAGAAKYYKANKIEKEEMRRGRSRKRSHSRHSHHSGHSASWSRSPSPVRSKSRRRSLSTVAKAALGTAATAGIVKHFRDKSKARSGSRGRSRSKSRSKSRLRKAAEIGGAAAVAGVGAKMWENHKEKKKRQSRERELSADDRAYSRRGSPGGRSLSRDRSRSRSRSRSLARSSHRDSADPELGLVEYGRDPLEPDAPSRGYESEAEERRRRRRRRRERNASTDEEGSGSERKRSKSRLRNVAAAGLASGAAAFGIKDYKDRKDAEKRERRSRERRERERSRDASIDRSPDRSRARSREVSRDRSRTRSRKGEAQSYFDSHGRSSPPTASGGAYYNAPYPATPNAGASSGGYAPYPPGDIPYVSQDYMGYAPPPPPNTNQPPANPGPTGYPAPPPGPPSGPHPPGGNYPPDHVSDRPRGEESTDDDVISETEGTGAPRKLRSKSVSFIPLSPQSSRTMERHRQDHQEHLAALETEADEGAQEKPRERGDDEHHGSDKSRRTSSPPDRASARRREEVEDLPDRFDAAGRPLDGRSASNRAGWTTRRGEFARRPRREGDLDVRGAWQVGGTDPEAVQRIVNGVTSALEGRQGLLRFIGDLFTGSAGLLTDGQSNVSGENRGRHRRR